MKYIVTMKHHRGAKGGNKAIGESYTVTVEAPEKLLAGSAARAHAKREGINGYVVSKIKEAV